MQKKVFCWKISTLINSLQKLIIFGSIRREKRSWTPCFSIIWVITPRWVSIAFRMFSVFNSSQLEYTSLTKPPFVFREGFRRWNFAFKPPYFKFFQVLLIDWSKTMQSGELTGKPPWSSTSKSVKLEIVFRSLTTPAPGQTFIPGFAHALTTHLWAKKIKMVVLGTSECNFLSLVISLKYLCCLKLAK